MSKSKSLMISLSVLIGAAVSAPVSACQMTQPYDASRANLVIVGEAIDIETDYLETKDTGWKKRPAESSRVTFKVLKVIKGEYDGDTVDATFGFNWFGGPEEDLDALRAGADNQAIIGMRLMGEPGAEQTGMIIGGICSSDYFMLKPKPNKDGDTWGEARWQRMLKLEPSTF